MKKEHEDKKYRVFSDSQDNINSLREESPIVYYAPYIPVQVISSNKNVVSGFKNDALKGKYARNLVCQKHVRDFLYIHSVFGGKEDLPKSVSLNVKNHDFKNYSIKSYDGSVDLPFSKLSCFIYDINLDKFVYRKQKDLYGEVYVNEIYMAFISKGYTFKTCTLGGTEEYSAKLFWNFGVYDGVCVVKHVEFNKINGFGRCSVSKVMRDCLG